MTKFIILAALGGTAGFAIIRTLIWFFDVTVCIDCYKKVRKRDSISAGYNNKEMRLCKDCYGKDKNKH